MEDLKRPRRIDVLPGLGLTLLLLGSSAELHAFGAGEPLPEPLADFFSAAEPSAQAETSTPGPSFEDQVMELVNEERWENGQLPPLKRNTLLDDAAETHSEHMAERDFFAHCDPDTGTLPRDRMEDAGYFYSGWAENVAAGYNSPQAVMNGWMNSTGHRDNILSTSWNELGIGYVAQGNDINNVRGDSNGNCTPDQFGLGPYFRYWTQNFGRRSNVYPVVINREAHRTESRDVELFVYGDSWATEMRIRNENDVWEPWEAFAQDLEWRLSPGNGIKQVSAEIRNGPGTVRSASDMIVLEQAMDIDTTGVFRPDTGALFLKNQNSSGYADTRITYGRPGDKPISGDWDGDGVDTIGVYRDGRFFLRNSNTNGFADIGFRFGRASDLPVAGDWNGDGIDTIGVYRNGQFLLRNSNSKGSPDKILSLCIFGDLPIAGDWNGDGIDTTGVFRPSSGALFLKNQNSTGFADRRLTYGIPGDKPITGDWNGDGVDTIGVYRNGRFLLRNSNNNGFADIGFNLGRASDIPLAGDWDGL